MLLVTEKGKRGLSHVIDWSAVTPMALNIPMTKVGYLIH